MNKKILSCFISLTLGATSVTSQAASCPADVQKLSAAERAKLPANCLTDSESSSLWWWVGGGTALAAAGIAIAAGGGDDDDDDDDDDFDDDDDYIEYYLRYGAWPSGTPQSIIDRWNNNNSGNNSNNGNNNNGNTDQGNSNGNSGTASDSFSAHRNTSGGVSAFAFSQANGTLTADLNSTVSGNNQYTARATGQGITVTQQASITTSAQNDATALYVTGNQATVNFAGTLTASGDDASVLELNGANSTVTLTNTSRTSATNGADAIDIEGANASVSVLGSLTVSGWDSTGVAVSGQQAQLTIGDSATVNVSSLSGTWRDDDVIASAFDIDGNALQVTQNSNNFVVGANATGIDAEASLGGSVLQNGAMTISGNGATGIRIESERATGSLTATNRGSLNVSAGGAGMVASGYGASLVNTGSIVVNNSGSALSAAYGASAINQGTITLSADGGIASGTLTALRGAGNSTLINDSQGIIHVNASGATPFTATASDTIVNRGKIYVNGSDATQQYALSNYTIGTLSASQAGTLYGQNLNLQTVQVDTAFADQTSATTVRFNDVVVGDNLSGAENIQSTSIVWTAQGVENTTGNIDVVMTKNRYDALVNDAALQQAARALEDAYQTSALYSSLNQASVSGLNHAISQISGRDIGLALKQARTLSSRFDRMADNALKSPDGLGFNIVDRHNPQAELGENGRYDMAALTQDFTWGDHQFTLRYGLARINGSHNQSADGVTGGYSQFFGLHHQQLIGDWQWKNQLDATIHQLDTTRNIRYDGISRQANASSKQQELRFDSTLGKTLALSKGISLEPYAGLSLRLHHADALQERRAGEWNLHLDAREKTAVDALAGVRFSWRDDRGLMLNATLEGGPNLHYREQSGYARLASHPGVRFKNRSQQGNGITSNAQVGVHWVHGNSALGLNAYHWQEDNQQDKGLLVKFNYQF
ncbi:hypothetical protein [Entomohabitans teleogrylli]|uniref:hypothetical protein n=1 Tax=Entomohabitans teleogrylli TaxID=1384589 RepID=UPI00073D948D|nr:hypothetical protein [Entomohabitans teleogrylli]